MILLQDWSRSAAEVIRPSASKHEGSSTTHNPMSANPQSVNPQSVNPLSANPSSVKSLDEPKSVETVEKKILSPNEAYISSLDNFLAVCDLIESEVVSFQT